MGRPPKAPEDVADRVMTMRLTDSDRAALLVLLEDDRKRLEAGPMGFAASKLAAVDVIRNLIRQEVERRGLSVSPTK
ncbi:MAG: hypothetical protein EOP84_05110 [Verrucomicrobiaceae bacterium]|nr:MAG: hypothetical protein EOP84_05110 [Verrucomicrobiaceae bacterium]